MRKIGNDNGKNTVNTDDAGSYELKTLSSDKKNFNDFVDGRSKKIDYSSIKRLVLSELALKKSITPQTICGFTRQQIVNMSKNPETYGIHILKLMDYIYQKSGYMRRLVDYFSNMPKLNYYIDKEITDMSFFKTKQSSYQKNFIKFANQCSKFNFSNIIHDITKRLYLNDVCYAYIVETDLDMSYFFLDPRCCRIEKIVNGNIFEFSINRSLITTSYFSTLPEELQNLIMESYNTSKNNLIYVPYEKGFCLKYNNNFFHLFPPFFPMISDILLIDEYKDLAKSKALNDAYKLLVLKVPVKDGQLTMNDDDIKPFILTALDVVQENIGVLPYPGDVESVEFSSSNSDDRDKVEDATKQMYANMGVSEALMSGASSGSELKLSITNDSADIFRIYRMIENWVSLQMKLRGYIYQSYQFIYKILDITIFNQSDVIDEELKLAQASIPNKERLCAASGMSPSAIIGNTFHEELMFKNIFDMWNPLKSSYTTSNNGDDDVGAPAKSDTDISEITQKTRDNDNNDPDNRI